MFYQGPSRHQECRGHGSFEGKKETKFHRVDEALAWLVCYPDVSNRVAVPRQTSDTYPAG